MQFFYCECNFFIVVAKNACRRNKEVKFPEDALLKTHWIDHLAILLVMFSLLSTVFIMLLPFADTCGGSQLALKLNSIS